MSAISVALPACDCAGPGHCPRYGRKMVGRLYELCSGRCPESRPCPDELRAPYIANWIGHEPPRGVRVTVSAPRSAGGPGTELKALLADLGLVAGGCQCESRARQMDLWGVAGCRENFSQIVSWLGEEYHKRGWGSVFRAGFRAVRSGLAFKLSPSYPLESIVTEAIARAEAKATLHP